VERHIDLDQAMIKHLEDMGYTVIPEGEEVPAPNELPALFHKCLERSREANKKYKDAWDYVSDVGLAEIIVMKAMRLRAAVENNDEPTALDSIVDLCNYGAKLYEELSIGPEA